MFNPVSNAIREIHAQIPPQILKFVFGKEEYRGWRREAPASIDEMIRSNVLYKRVMTDCNLIGGRHVIISLEGLQGYQQDTYTMVYDIPIDRTGGREIISVLSVSYLPDSTSMGSMGTPYASVNPVTNSDVATAAQRVMDSFSNVPHISVAEVELIGFNTVVVRDQYRPTITYGLRCILANEENLSNLSPKSYRAFAKACVLATKAHIYKSTIITMDQGYLEQGQALGEFKTQIDKFEDAEELYQDYLTNTLQKVLFMNDVHSYNRFIGIQVNPGL